MHLLSSSESPNTYEQIVEPGLGSHCYGSAIQRAYSPGYDRLLEPASWPRFSIVLCPVEAVQGTVKDILGNVVNPTASEHTDTKDNGTDSGARYLCALVTPALMAEAYELNLWRQIVIHVGMTDKKVFLEYDAGARYYYISV